MAASVGSLTLPTIEISRAADVKGSTLGSSRTLGTLGTSTLPAGGSRRISAAGGPRRQSSGGDDRLGSKSRWKSKAVPDLPHPAAEFGKKAPEAWIQGVLDAHNDLRIRHHTPPLNWSEECFEHARLQVEVIAAKRDAFNGYTDGLDGLMGQSLAGPYPKSRTLDWSKQSAQRVVKEWYNEISKYDFEKEEVGEEDGSNFTQVVWFQTTSVGMAISKDGLWCVANYYPRGNQNVFFRTSVRPVQEGRAPWKCMDPWPLPPCPNYRQYLGPIEPLPPWQLPGPKEVKDKPKAQVQIELPVKEETAAESKRPTKQRPKSATRPQSGKKGGDKKSPKSKSRAK
eukprot:TRINITY_DN31011_c0_g1_i1.p1 TRINITY_DN31011_c0_g1~~TRINITY_DN31011_c0_g1_i1.p1  ORF type:complete len:340 (-),score=71.41 TRINITY_DN31011_c0_g1_i1:104-1123(-)